MYNNVNFLESFVNKYDDIIICDVNKINTFSNLINKENIEIQKWNRHQRMVSEIKKFKAKGIIIYTNGIKKIFLRFYWSNINANHYKFKAYTFFGTKLLEYVSNHNKIYFKDNNKITNLNINSENLFEKFFRIKIPINNLSSWLIGLPGNSKEFNINDSGMLKEIKYKIDSQNYTIIYDKYYNNINPPLPINIKFNQGNNTINLKINSWIIS